MSISQLRFMIVILGCFALSGCGEDRVPTVGEVTGTYESTYGKEKGIKETFVLRADQTYTQTLYLNGKVYYTNSGEWKPLLNGLKLVKPIAAMDIGGSLGPPFQKWDKLDAVWSNYQGTKSFAIDIDNNYCAIRIGD